MKKFSKPWLPCSQKRNPKAKRISPILEDSITTSDFRSFVYQTLERRRLNMTALHTTFGVLRTFRQSFKSSMQRLFTNLNSQNKPPPPNVDRQYHDHWWWISKVTLPVSSCWSWWPQRATCQGSSWRPFLRKAPRRRCTSPGRHLLDDSMLPADEKEAPKSQSQADDWYHRIDTTKKCIFDYFWIFLNIRILGSNPQLKWNIIELTATTNHQPQLGKQKKIQLIS